MYELVDSFEAKFKTLEQSEDAILEMFRQNLASHKGLKHRESKTNSDSESWEELPCYKVTCATVEHPDIEWDAALYNAQLERALIVGEPEDFVADAPTIVDLVDSRSIDGSTCCIQIYFGPRNHWNNSKSNCNISKAVEVFSLEDDGNADNGTIQT